MTTIIVEKIDGTWQRAEGVQQRPVAGEFHTSRTVSYHDGRQPIEEDCDPYPKRVTVDIANVARLVEEGVWGEEELSRLGLAAAEPFTVPEGKQVVEGTTETFKVTKGVIRQVLEVEDRPPDPPPPTEEEVLAGLFAERGLSLDRVREILLPAGDAAEAKAR